MLRERVPVAWSALAVLAGVTLLLAASPQRVERTTEITACPAELAAPAPTDPVANAHVLYVAGDFAGAAETVRMIASTSELQSLAELYEAFASAYTIAMAPDAPDTDAFDALREAQSLDIALGGEFAAELAARMHEVAPRAAAAFAAQHDPDRAALAQHTAELSR